MEMISRYILSVIAAAMILGILKGVLSEKSGASALIRLIGGIFLAFVVISPVAKLDFSDPADFWENFSSMGTDAATDGEQIADKEYRSIIKSSTEAYILDKAKTYQAELAVEVSLSDAEIPVPAAVRLQGDISPYGKIQMQRMMENDLGIAKENQQWIG